MDRSRVAIRRYWRPIQSKAADQAFGADDSDWWRLVLARDTKMLEELREVPCMLLLGEPGMGKSTAIRDEVELLLKVTTPHQHVVCFDLATVSSDSGLDELFNSETISRWSDASSKEVLSLFFDSYDECLRRYSNLKPRLVDRLRSLPLRRLRLRIACRTGDFPGNLPDDLRRLWPSASDGTPVDIQTLILEPLNRSSIQAWAASQKVDGKAFLQLLSRKSARAFAGRPITLRPLLELYRRDRFPDSEVELFEFSIAEICNEVNLDRGQEPRLSQDERVLIAERIAVLTTLAGKSLVWLGTAGLGPENCIELREVIGGEERAGGPSTVVDRQSVMETLSTALFTVQDNQIMRWSQDVYREFLAARFFARRTRTAKAALQFLEIAGNPRKMNGSLRVRSLKPPLGWQRCGMLSQSGLLITILGCFYTVLTIFRQN